MSDYRNPVGDSASGRNHVISVNRTREAPFSAHCTCGWEAGPATAVHPELAEEVKLHGSLYPRESARTSPCSDCGVGVGNPHIDWCDLARCLETGTQRISCAERHDHGRDIWTGEVPGAADSERLGVLPAELGLVAVWDQERAEWVPKEPS